MAPHKIAGGMTPGKESFARAGRLTPPRSLLTWFHRLTRRMERHPVALHALSGSAVVAMLVLLASSSTLPPGMLPVLGVCLLVAFLLGTCYLYIVTLQPEPVRRPRSLFLIASVMLLTVAIARGFLFLNRSVVHALPAVPLSSLEYAVPVALGGLLLAILFNSRLAFAGGLAICILTALLASVELRFFLYNFVGTLTAIFAIVGQKERATLLKAGGLVALANLYSILAWSFLSGMTGSLGFDLVCALVNGLLVAILALGLLPLFEYVFEVATDFRLIELGNLHHPLLRQMMLRAPGTYHHSVVVGTMAEAAAEAIGASTLLCRVGAYFHDIGKMTKPLYFVENETDAKDRHGKMKPSLSALVIMSHVKAGIELGRAYGLPPAILDMIPQHHGTRLVTFFYHKAKRTHDPELGQVREEAFRYPGPKPQTKEAAILMLADAVEAAARTLVERTPARFQSLVHTVVNAIFADGQLDECELTLRELRLIEESFVLALSGIHHQRVDYPGFVFDSPLPRRDSRDRELSRAGILESVDDKAVTRGGGNDDPRQRPAKEDQARHDVSKKGRANHPR